MVRPAAAWLASSRDITVGRLYCHCGYADRTLVI
jgi:hypothetical protein